MTQLLLLGTAGGPRLNRFRSQPAQVIMVDDTPYVVDCGFGVGRQLVHAGIALTRLSTVFVTHHHSDHNGDYGNLLHQAWLSGLSTPVDTYGPPPIVEMTEQFLRLNAYDIETRTHDEGRPELAPLLRPHGIGDAGLVFQDSRVRVTAALVNHPPVEPSFAYRFDTSDRSIVISGDTTPSENLIRLAESAEVLVHEVMYEDALPRVANAARVREHLLASHTTLADVGRVATSAGVRTLVLSHFVPADNPPVTDAMWLQGAQANFSGEVIVGHDLMTL
jgi:ribonuclease BN (tRNA processing enzyme)